MKRFLGDQKTNHSFLKPVEKQIIKHTLPFIPKSIEGYQLTLLTVFWSMGILICSYFARTNVWFMLGVSFGILGHYISDSFDGPLGRRSHAGLSRWGYYMDHLFDFLFLCVILLGYSIFFNYAHVILLFFYYGIFGGLMVNSFLQFGITKKFPVSYFGIGPSELQIGFMILNLVPILWGKELLITILSVAVPVLCGVFLFVIYKTQKYLWNLDTKEKYLEPFAHVKKHISLRYRIFKFKYMIILLMLGVSYLNFYVYITNPFNKNTIVQDPFSVSENNGHLVLHKNFDVQVQEGLLYQLFAFYTSGVHIVANTYIGSIPAKGVTKQQIIANIHTLRFNPDKPYIISGDQFSEFYPRNLSIFYGSILDSHTALNKQDFENRQKIYLLSTAYALTTLSKTKNLYTTIVPVGTETVTAINIYSYPSDTLYGILYALSLMQQKSNGPYQLQTQQAAVALVNEYKDSLARLFSRYKQTVFDEKTGLVKKTIYLSSARDSVKRESSFYDNVIYWKTAQLASELGIVQVSDKDLNALKTKILETFWYKNGGYFLNDLSEESLQQKSYSSDWLIVTSTGFLNPKDPQERAYLEQSVAYIQKNNIDKPFGIKYQKQSNPQDEFAFVRFFVPSYGQNAIWSHWGIEYIKLLIALYHETGESAYFTSAKNQLQQYANNIVTYKGYPEVYFESGKFLENLFYKSVRQTGWVINFEQAEYLLYTLSKGAMIHS